MSPSKKLIGELTEKSGRCTLKVKIVEKFRPMCSLQKTKYQRYVMRDEKGDETSATVFGDDVDVYDKTIKQHGQHEISNAKIKLDSEIIADEKKMPKKYSEPMANHMYDMSNEERDHFLHEIGVELVNKAFYVKVAPSPGLAAEGGGKIGFPFFFE
ncbi:hypothetical protein Cgig2_011788 [Carnegiea gigantea]|uniref:Uncharacterized protein n=1 Tax=Carnegiea gigantea TaxID=171969 RepID=A0A9Q1JN48_9CARY|nr:hypothetical protein Cgig2_011788 [Carnegiea gigantea]